MPLASRPIGFADRARKTRASITAPELHTSCPQVPPERPRPRSWSGRCLGLLSQAGLLMSGVVQANSNCVNSYDAAPRGNCRSPSMVSFIANRLAAEMPPRSMAIASGFLSTFESSPPLTPLPAIAYWDREAARRTDA